MSGSGHGGSGGGYGGAGGSSPYGHLGSSMASEPQYYRGPSFSGAPEPDPGTTPPPLRRGGGHHEGEDGGLTANRSMGRRSNGGGGGGGMKKLLNKFKRKSGGSSRAASQGDSASQASDLGTPAELPYQTPSSSSILRGGGGGGGPAVVGSRGGWESGPAVGGGGGYAVAGGSFAGDTPGSTPMAGSTPLAAPAGLPPLQTRTGGGGRGSGGGGGVGGGGGRGGNAIESLSLLEEGDSFGGFHPGRQTSVESVADPSIPEEDRQRIRAVLEESRLLAAQQQMAVQDDDEALRMVLEESARQAETEPVLREMRLVREDLRTNLSMLKGHAAALEAVRGELVRSELASDGMGPKSNRVRRQLQEVVADLAGVRASIEPVEAAVRDLEGFEEFVRVDRPTRAEAEALRDSLLEELHTKMENAGLMGLLMGPLSGGPPAAAAPADASAAAPGVVAPPFMAQGGGGPGLPADVVGRPADVTVRPGDVTGRPSARGAAGGNAVAAGGGQYGNDGAAVPQEGPLAFEMPRAQARGAPPPPAARTGERPQHWEEEWEQQAEDRQGGGAPSTAQGRVVATPDGRVVVIPDNLLELDSSEDDEDGRGGGSDGAGAQGQRRGVAAEAAVQYSPHLHSPQQRGGGGGGACVDTSTTMLSSSPGSELSDLAMQYDRGMPLSSQGRYADASPPTIMRAPMPPGHSAATNAAKRLGYGEGPEGDAGQRQQQWQEGRDRGLEAGGLETGQEQHRAAAAVAAMSLAGGSGAGSRPVPSGMTDLEAALQDIRRTREELEARLRGSAGLSGISSGGATPSTARSSVAAAAAGGALAGAAAGGAGYAVLANRSGAGAEHQQQQHPGTPGSLAASTPATGRSYRSTPAAGRPTIVEMYREQRQRMLDEEESGGLPVGERAVVGAVEEQEEGLGLASESGLAPGSRSSTGRASRPLAVAAAEAAASQAAALENSPEYDRTAATAQRLSTEMATAAPETLAQAAALVRDMGAAIDGLPREVLEDAGWPQERYDAMQEGVRLGSRLAELQASQLSHKVGSGTWHEECAQLYTLLEGVRAEMEDLESSRDASAARFAVHGVPFQPSAYEAVRRAGLRLGGAYMDLVLTEVVARSNSRGEDPASAAMGSFEQQQQSDRQAVQSLTDALRVAYRCHAFAGAWDDACREQYGRLRKAALLYTQRVVRT